MSRIHDIAKMRGYEVPESDHNMPTNEATKGVISGLIKPGLAMMALQKVLAPKPAPPKVSTPLESLKRGDKIDVYDLAKGEFLYRKAVVQDVDAPGGSLRIQGDQGSKNINVNDYAVVKS